MSEGTSPDGGWFEGLDPGDLDGARDAINGGSAGEPTDWPARAVAVGFADDVDEYYDLLHDTTVSAARAESTARLRASDRQLIHAVRAMDDLNRVANELAERTSEWGAGRFDVEGSGVAFCRDLAGRTPEDDADERVVSLAARVVALADEADALKAFLESRTPAVAPNLAALAGPVLAARLIALAGGLESLAKKPSGTLQVLGAEEALFAHLRGHAPSPKHGVIYTHEYVRGTRPEDRGSAARALAGKLTIAARIDHYSGERRPELDGELDERIRTIRARAETGGDADAMEGEDVDEMEDGSADGGDDGE